MDTTPRLDTLTREILIQEARADASEAAALIAELDAELAERHPGAPIFGLHAGEAQDPALRFFLVWLGDQVVGCGALRQLSPGIGELKRMFIRQPYRGRGLARALLNVLEQTAQAAGMRSVRLETGVRQVEALSLYRSAGYEEIPCYSEYIGSPESICLEKILRLGSDSRVDRA